MTQASMPKIRILLLDDHTLFRDGLTPQTNEGADRWVETFPLH
jgi:hypothetical protein